MKIFKIPFAATGDKIAIPTVEQPSGEVSQPTGWTPYYQLPNTDPNYKPVGRDEMNGILFEITEALGQLQQFGFADWQNITGGWPVGANVNHGGGVWQSLANANTEEPGTGSLWKRILFDDIKRATESVLGLTQLATVAQAKALTADNVVITPKKLSEALNGVLGSSASRNVGTTAGTVAAGDDSRITGAAQKSANLSDLTNAATARSNLGIPQVLGGYVPTQRVISTSKGLQGGGDLTQSRHLSVVFGTSQNTVAAGDDSRITGAAQKSANLSDLTNAATARSNLGLGGSATRNVGTGTMDVMRGDDARVVNAVPRQRNVYTSTGLVGGGDLTQDRTLALASAYIPIGVSQGWVDVTESRSLNTTFFNTTGRPILIAVTVIGEAASGAGLYIQTAGQVIGEQRGAGAGAGIRLRVSAYAIIPASGSYTAAPLVGGETLNAWMELR